MAEASPVPQRGMWWRATAIAGILLLGGCQSLFPRGRPAPVERAPETTRPAETPRLPVETPTLPSDVERHRVALLVPITGSNARVGQSLVNSTQLALLDTRSERVRITTYDTGAGAAAAATRAIAEGNRLILGPLLAEDVRIVAPIARRAGVPLLSFSNDVGVAGSGTFVMGYSPVQSIERVVSYARERGVTKFAGLVPSGLYGERASTAFLRAVESGGGQVVSLQSYDRAAASLSGAITRMSRDSAYEAILIADGVESAVRAIPLIRRAGGSTARILGTELWNTDTALGAKPALSGAWFASVADGLYGQYAGKYRARFGTSPFRLSSLGYDSVLLTVRIARDWKVGEAFPARMLVDRGGFAGIDGAFRFGNDGVAQRALEVQEMRGAAVVTVSAAPKTFGE